MSKQQIVDRVQSLGMSKAKAKQAVDSILDVITNSLCKDEKLNIQGFGTLSVRDRKEREGRNPQTGERITIPATRQVKFTPSKALKERLK